MKGYFLDFSGVSITFIMRFRITFYLSTSIITDLPIFSQNCSSLLSLLGSNSKGP